jgi:hypothetical protein
VLGLSVEVVHPETHTREDRADLGRGMGKGGAKDRVAEVGAAPRLRGSAAPVGRRADVRLVVPQLQNEQGLRRLCATSEAFVYAAMVRLMVRRLARA